jgi:hypothetical protein
MTNRIEEMNIALPVEICFQTLLEAGSALKGWKANKIDQKNFINYWKCGQDDMSG